MAKGPPPKSAAPKFAGPPRAGKVTNKPSPFPPKGRGAPPPPKGKKGPVMDNDADDY